MTRASLVVIGALLGAPNVAREARVSIVAGEPPQAVAATCQLARGRDDPSRTGRLLRDASRWLWRVEEGDTLACDAPGLEPVDVVGARLTTQDLLVRMLPARSVRLQSEWRGGAVVEWLEEQAGSLLPVAVRALDVSGQNVLSVAKAPDRLLRVRRGDASPVTLVLPAGESEASRTLRPPVPGGELVARLAEAAIAPRELILVGGKRAMVVSPVPDGWLILPGLSPASYSVDLSFIGGVVRRGPSFSIERGQSTTLLPLPVPSVGGVTPLLSERLCGVESRVSVRHVVGKGSESFREVALLERVSCSDVLAIDGLDPGVYDVSVSAPGVANSTARVEVVAGERTAVRLADGDIRVAGRVTLGSDNPLSNIFLSFSSEDTEVQAATGQDGNYEAVLPKAGTYLVTASAGGFFPIAWFSRALTMPDERADFRIAGGIVEVEFSTSDGSGLEDFVQVHAAGAEHSHSGFFRLEKERIRLAGLKFDSYRISANTAAGYTSENPATIEITQDNPFGKVRIVLSRTEGTLRLVDEGGAAVLDAVARAGDSLLRPTGPGSFAMRRLAHRSRLVVYADGFVPVCHVTRSQDYPELEITLHHGGGAARFAVAESGQAPRGSVEGLPDSTCPVPLWALRHRMEETEGTVVITIDGLPQGEFLYRRDDGRTIPFVVTQ